LKLNEETPNAEDSARSAVKNKFTSPGGKQAKKTPSTPIEADDGFQNKKESVA